MARARVRPLNCRGRDVHDHRDSLLLGSFVTKEIILVLKMRYCEREHPKVHQWGTSITSD